MKRIEEIIELIEITGDKCVILHKQTQAYVVMKLDDYKGFYENRFNQSSEIQEKENKDVRRAESQPSAFVQTSDRIKPIPQQPADIKEFEIKKQSFFAGNEDVYYPEPLLE